MTISANRSRLFQLLNAPALDALLVTADVTGEVQVVAEGSGPMDRVLASVQGGSTSNLLEAAPLDWWRTSATLVNAVEQGWLSVPADQISAAPAPAPDVVPTLEDHFVIRWRDSTPTTLSGVGQALQQFTNGKLRLSENGGSFRNVLDPVDVLPVAYAASIALDFNPDLTATRRIALTGDVTFTSSNLAPGRRVTVLLATDALARAFSFPGGWRFVGGDAPTALAGNHVAILTLVSFGSTDAEVIALYSADVPIGSASQLISVKDVAYGAVGNGIANDTAAIQAALTAAGAAYTATGTRQTIFFPAGVYLVSQAGSSAWCLDVPSGVICMGPGKVKMAPGQPNNIVGFSIQNRKHVIIDGLTFDGDSANQGLETDPKNHAFFTRGSQNVYLRNIRVENVDGDAFYFGKGTGVGDDAFAHNCSVQNFYVDGSRRSAVTLAQGARYITVSRGYCVNWSGDQSAAINIESSTDPSPGATFEDVYIDNPRPEGVHRCYAISLSNGPDCLIRRCRMPSTIIITGSDDVNIEDNTIVHPGSGFAFLNGGTPGESCIQIRTTCNRVRISRNNLTISGPTGVDPDFDIACIYVVNTNSNLPRDVLISENRCQPNGRYGIVVQGLAGVVQINNNYIDCQNGLGRGILSYTPNNAMDDLRLVGNVIKNCANSSGAISFTTTANGATNGFKRITCRDNTVLDDQVTPTTLRALEFLAFGTAGYGDVLLEGNRWSSNIATGIYGLNYWRTGGNVASVQADGTILGAGEYVGFNNPDGQVTSGVGSTFRRLNGGAGSTFYVKESGDTNTGWVAK